MASLHERLGGGSRRFMRTWSTPEHAEESRDQQARNYRYARLWDIYDGTAFADMRAWADYKKTYGLYRQIRQVWDHAHETVEFYVTHVWSGSLAKDGLNLPDGQTNAIPLAEDTDPKLAAAIAQCWSWWNFQTAMTQIVRYTAAIGELLVEINDNTAKGRIDIELIWPGYVKDIRLDNAGNVKSYVIEYAYYDREAKRTYTYRREVDGDSFRTFRDNTPHDYQKNPMPEGTDPGGSISVDLGTGSIFFDANQDDGGDDVANPYGFVRRLVPSPCDPGCARRTGDLVDPGPTRRDQFDVLPHARQGPRLPGSAHRGLGQHQPQRLAARPGQHGRHDQTDLH